MQVKELFTFKTLEEARKGSKMMSQTEALLLMLSGRNVFLSGPAGSGKTFVIQKYCELMQKIYPTANIVKTATTGLASVSLGGRTTHSWSGLGVSALALHEREEGLPHYAFHGIRKTDILIIDEISMLSEFGLTFVRDAIKRAKRKSWRNLQVIVVGDFSQLPPVRTKGQPEEHGNFCYKTEAWGDFSFAPCYIDKIYRTEDEKLLEILENISLGYPEYVDLSSVKVITSPQNVDGVILVPTNRMANKINKGKQAKNPNKIQTFKMVVSQSKDQKKKDLAYAKRCQMDQVIKLKSGDRVMIVMNDPSSEDLSYVEDVSDSDAPRLQNGMIGTFGQAENGHPTFTYRDPKTEKEYIYTLKDKILFKELRVSVDKNGRKTERVVASFRQIPLRLAYSISIHKSQGQTYSHLACDLRNCWTENLGYVSLSRAKSLEGLRLYQPNVGARPYNDMALKISRESLDIKRDILKETKELKEHLKEEFDKLWEMDIDKMQRDLSSSLGLSYQDLKEIEQEKKEAKDKLILKYGEVPKILGRPSIKANKNK